VDFSRVRSHVPPLYQTVNYEYADADEGISVFKKEKPGYIYTRDSNPTTDLLSEVVMLLEEGEAALVAASGMAAISSTFLALAKPDDHIVSSSAIYGGTRALLRDHLGALGYQTTFVDITNHQAVEAAVTAKSKILYTEVVANSNLSLADVEFLSNFANNHGMIMVVDNTFTPPPIIQPLKLGAHVVIHSATKYLGGHGDLIGGVVVSSEPIVKQISQVIKLYGGTMSPFNAWLALRGIKTLGVRIERHCSNAMKIADFLSNHPKVSQVFYPGLSDHPQHSLAQRLLKGYGGMMAFEVKGGLEAGKKLINSVQICNFTASLGEIDTIITHPASTSHVALTPEERAAIDVSDGLIRLSVGIEEIQDLLADLEQALENA
jgi:methionine-gamma-lyase